MFDQVSFQAFKCLADITTTLTPLTALVGGNGSGKSSVLDGLHLLCQVGARRAPDPSGAGRTESIFRGRADPRRLRTRGDQRALVISGAKGAAHLSLKAAIDDATEEIRFTIEAAPPALVIDQADDPNTKAMKFGKLDALGFGRAIRLRFDPDRISAFTPDQESPRVAYDGSGVAGVLALLAEQRSGALEAIEADLRSVVPRARRLIPTRAEGPGGDRTHKVTGRRFELETDGGDRIEADLLSEGTLLTIALLTVLHKTPVPRLILLDDLDRALHPRALRDLIVCIRSVMQASKDLQILCTTHSPYVLDYFEAEEVRVLRLDTKGTTRIRALAEHEEWARWKATMKPGEFWSYVGEDWLDGPTATPGA